MPQSGFTNAWLATAAVAETQGTCAPHAKNLLATAMPIAPVSGSLATIEYVTTLPFVFVESIILTAASQFVEDVERTFSTT